MRYVAIPERARLPFEDYEGRARIMGSLDVEEREWRKTGLVDRHGQELYRAPNAIGFQAKIE